MEKVWIVGKYLCDGKIGGTVAWELIGVYNVVTDAIAKCTTEKHFVGPVTIGVKMPEHPNEWPDAFYPLVEDSDELLYKTWLMDAVTDPSCVWPTPKPEYVNRLARENRGMREKLDRDCPVVDTLGGEKPCENYCVIDGEDIQEAGKTTHNGGEDFIVFMDDETKLKSEYLRNKEKIAKLTAELYDAEHGVTFVV